LKHAKNFRRKLAKIAKNCDHNIDPCKFRLPWWILQRIPCPEVVGSKTEMSRTRNSTEVISYLDSTPSAAGLPDGIFSNKNLNLGKFCRALQQKMLGYYSSIWSILWLFGISCGHLVYFVGLRISFPRFGRYVIPKKCGNPDLQQLKSVLHKSIRKEQIYDPEERTINNRADEDLQGCQMVCLHTKNQNSGIC
jgi:hypothetical protein